MKIYEYDMDQNQLKKIEEIKKSISLKYEITSDLVKIIGVYKTHENSPNTYIYLEVPSKFQDSEMPEEIFNDKFLGINGELVQLPEYINVSMVIELYELATKSEPNTQIFAPEGVGYKLINMQKVITFLNEFFMLKGKDIYTAQNPFFLNWEERFPFPWSFNDTKKEHKN